MLNVFGREIFPDPVFDPDPGLEPLLLLLLILACFDDDEDEEDDDIDPALDGDELEVVTRASPEAPAVLPCGSERLPASDDEDEDDADAAEDEASEAADAALLNRCDGDGS